MEKGHLIPVLDHGSVRYLEHMGNDYTILEAARVSYGSASKGDAEDKKLLNYLWKNKHCYHPDMEVLTVEGWKKWRDCGKKEHFLVPDPKTKRYTVELLPVLSFKCDEELYTFNNNRMSYAVTKGHRMFFRGKYQKEFSISKVEDTKDWGWFEPLKDYATGPIEIADPEMEFVGFFLGDGSLASKNVVSFHLKKPRKMQYLRDLCAKLGLVRKESPSSTHDDGIVFYVEAVPLLEKWINLKQKAQVKEFPLKRVNSLTQNQKMGLWGGLANSDGSVSKARPQIHFSSTSEKLLQLFELLCACTGVVAHRIDTGVLSFVKGGRTSLESRKQYKGKLLHKGKVYCATTSTGLLAVRGTPNSHGFICGNTSPFEMVKIRLTIIMPIFIARQYIRHRMQNVNEVSARYTELPSTFYLPKEWRTQDKKNKQASVEQGGWDPEVFEWKVFAGSPSGTQRIRISASEAVAAHCQKAYDLYEELLKVGVAREMARIVLPLNVYTEMTVCWDLKNLLHFITLRDDAHAQPEIQVYGKAIKQILQEIVPWTMEAYERYQFMCVDKESVYAGSPESERLGRIGVNYAHSVRAELGLSYEGTAIAPVGQPVIYQIWHAGDLLASGEDADKTILAVQQLHKDRLFSSGRTAATPL